MLGSVPPMRQAGLADMFPTASVQPGQWPRAAGPPPPDHYAIVTPEGRFEIEELSDRGLYRAQRTAWQQAWSQTAYAQLHDGYEQASYDGSTEPLDLTEPATLEDAPAAEPAAEAAKEPPALASSGFRVIDVTAELAARRQSE